MFLQTLSYLYPAEFEQEEQAINLWVIIRSAIGGLVMLVLLGVEGKIKLLEELVVLLWKVRLYRLLFLVWYCGR